MSGGRVGKRLTNAPDSGPLVFIDTNIYLRFYSGNEAAVSILDKIEANADRLICTEQVHMEFLKHRQLKLLEMRKPIRNDIPEGIVHPPQIFRVRRSKTDKARLALNRAIAKERAQIDSALRNPRRRDPVYRLLARLMKARGHLVLTRKRTVEYEAVRTEAYHRYLLGYPPRKNSDTSFGDAFNWEWIVRCAEEQRRDVVIVTNDSDYGPESGNERHINDWLAIEFRQRTKQRITATSRLAVAFKDSPSPLTKNQETAENKAVGPVTQTFNLGFGPTRQWLGATTDLDWPFGGLASEFEAPKGSLPPVRGATLTLPLDVMSENLALLQANLEAGALTLKDATTAYLLQALGVRPSTAALQPTKTEKPAGQPDDKDP